MKTFVLDHAAYDKAYDLIWDGTNKLQSHVHHVSTGPKMPFFVKVHDADAEVFAAILTESNIPFYIQEAVYA